MKVIKPATKWTKECTCGHCQAILLIEKGDVLWSWWGYPPNDHTAYFVRCAECNSAIKLDEATLPSRVKDDAPQDQIETPD
jgi:hypothetical protein